MKWPKLNPGELVHRISILQPVAGSDESGATVTMQPLFANVPAKIEVVRGIDVLRSGQATTQLYVTVSIWFRTGILPNMQVQGKNGLYVIQSVENVLERGIVLKLNCLALGRNE